MMRIRYLSVAPIVFLALAATNAVAQEASLCGQPEALTQGTFEIAGQDSPPIDATIEISRGEPVYLEFAVQSATGVTIETFSNDYDPLVILFDADGQMVRSDDDGSGNLNARLGVQLEPGDYCAQIKTLTEVPAPTGALPSGFDGAVPIQIRTGITAGSGGCLSQPALVTLDSIGPGFDAKTLEGQVQANGAFQFSLAEETALALGVRSSDFDTILNLEDANGVQLGSDDDGGGGTNSFLSFESPLPAGDYCVSVTSYDENTGNYSLTLEEWSDEAASRGGGSGAPADPCGDANATTVISGPLTTGFAGQNISQNLANPHQFFQFDVVDPVELRLTATSGDFDTIMGLYDADGAEINSNDDGDGLGTNSRIQPGSTLAAGTYCAAVSAYSGEGTGAFRFELIELTEEALLSEAYANGEILPSSTSGIEFTDLGLLERSSRSETAEGGAQWYLFEVDEESLIVADVASLGDVSKIVLFDYEGTGFKIAETISVPDAPTTRLVKKVGSGIYALTVVRDAGGAARGAAALSLQRFVRPPRAQ